MAITNTVICPNTPWWIRSPKPAAWLHYQPHNTSAKLEFTLSIYTHLTGRYLARHAGWSWNLADDEVIVSACPLVSRLRASVQTESNIFRLVEGVVHLVR